jgi:hypothetical protein
MLDPLHRLFEYGHVSDPSGTQLGTHQAATEDATVGIDIVTKALLIATAMLQRAFLFPRDPDLANGKWGLPPMLDLGTLNRERRGIIQRKVASLDRFQRLIEWRRFLFIHSATGSGHGSALWHCTDCALSE